MNAISVFGYGIASESVRRVKKLRWQKSPAIYGLEFSIAFIAMLDKCACEHVIDRVRRAEGVSIFELNGFVFLQNLFKEHLVSAAMSPVLAVKLPLSMPTRGAYSFIRPSIPFTSSEPTSIYIPPCSYRTLNRA